MGKCERLHKKNGKKRGKMGFFLIRFGEMGQNLRSATREHNYGVRFFEWRYP
jgi:hypothetical protein